MLSYKILTLKDRILLKKISEPIYNLLKKTIRIPEEFEYQLVEVDNDFIARPDLLSLNLYGVPDYADVICKINGISNPFELNKGMVLVAPTTAWIERFYITSLEKSNSETLYTDTIDVKKLQKKINTPRSANQQVLTDRNFRIDRTNKIIIY